jgi:HEAT repeat protein
MHVEQIDTWIGQLLYDVDWRTRRRAANELTRYSVNEATNALMSAVSDEDEDVVQAAILALIPRKPVGLKALLTKPRLLASDNPSLRWTVAYALRSIGDTSDCDSLFRLIHDEDWQVRDESISTLEELVARVGRGTTATGADENVKLLIRMLSLDHVRLRDRIVEALGSRFKTVAIQPWIAALDSENPRIRQGVLTVLARLGTRNEADAISRHADDDDAEVRLAVVKALGIIGGITAIRTLVERFGDGDARVVAAAIGSLVTLAGQPVLNEILLDRLRHTCHAQIKRNILYTMGQLKHPSHIMPLLEHLGNSRYLVRMAAAQALVLFGDRVREPVQDCMALNPIPIDPLVQVAVASDHVLSRIQAIRVLGRLRNSRALHALQELGDDTSEVIAETAVIAAELVRCSSWERAKAAWILGELGRPESIPILLANLADQSLDVRAACIAALRRIRDKAAAPAIARQAQMETDPDMIAECLKALNELGEFGGEVRDLLLQSLNHPAHAVRLEAVRALGHVPDAHVADLLIERLGDDELPVRESALNSLYTLGTDGVPKLVSLFRSSRGEPFLINAVSLIGLLRAEAHADDVRKLQGEHSSASVRNRCALVLQILAGGSEDSSALFHEHAPVTP